MSTRRPVTDSAASLALAALLLVWAAAPVPCASAADAEQPPAVVESLETGELAAHLGSDDAAVRKAARKALLARGDAALPALLAQLEDERFRVRWETVNTLGYLKHQAAMLPLIDRALRDDNPHVRWRSLWALGAMGRDEAVIAELLRSLEEPAQRWNAAVGLGSMFAVRQAIPILLEGLASGDSWIRFEAIFSLGRVFDEATSAALLPLLDHPELKTRQNTVLSLGRIRDEVAVQGLIKALGDADAQVRWRAAMALQRVDDRRAAEALTALLQTEQDETVIRHARDALERTGAGQR